MIRVLKVCEFLFFFFDDQLFIHSVSHDSGMLLISYMRMPHFYDEGKIVWNVSFCDATSSTNDLKKLCNVNISYPHEFFG